MGEVQEQLELIDKANVPPEVKEGVHRNRLFDEARVLLAKNDIAGAKAKSKTYATQVAQKKSRSRCGSSTSWRA